MEQTGGSRSYRLPRGHRLFSSGSGTSQKSTPMRAGDEVQLVGCPPTVREVLGSALSTVDCVWWRMPVNLTLRR